MIKSWIQSSRYLLSLSFLLAIPEFLAAQMTWQEILPTPQSVEEKSETIDLRRLSGIEVSEPLHGQEFNALKRLQQDFDDKLEIKLPYMGLLMEERVSPTIKLSKVPPMANEEGFRDVYKLIVNHEGVLIEADTPVGLFYGLQTLRQAVRLAAAEETYLIPHGTIEDGSEFQYRGFYHDISRGKVPTIETLKELIDLLALNKANMFQLYIEHPFLFPFNNRIAQNPDGLTPQDIRELDLYCKEQRIEFVPSLQSFGHMGGALSLPEYRHLADIELEGNWEDLSWNDRMTGATLDVTNPDALELMEKMHRSYTALFTSDFVNVCADETYHLGRGKALPVAEEIGVGRLYLRHMKWLNDLSHQMGKRMMFWGDIVKKHEDLVSEIPKDAILLNWGYWAKTNFESTKLFADAGLDFFVCPGTSGWNRLINGIHNAEINIRKYAETGKKYGAMGLLNTDWGDHGHFNPLGGSLHGIILGTSVAWNPETIAPEEYDIAWEKQVFGRGGEQIAEGLRLLDSSTEFRETWIKTYAPIDGEKRFTPLTKEDGDSLVKNGKQAEAIFQETLNTLQEEDQRRAVEEYLHSAKMHQLLGEKTLLVHRWKESGSDLSDELKDEARLWIRKSRTLMNEYQQIWMARNRYSEFDDLMEIMNRLYEQIDEFIISVGNEAG